MYDVRDAGFRTAVGAVVGWEPTAVGERVFEGGVGCCVFVFEYEISAKKLLTGWHCEFLDGEREPRSLGAVEGAVFEGQKFVGE